MKKIIKKIFEGFTHFLGRITGKYYFEDYVRVYPGGARFNKIGKRVKTTQNDINNYLNHTKFYGFASQFVQGKKVADVGCGSGYGCEILKKAGAVYVHGYDVSKASINFATSHYSKEISDFSIASITDMKIVKDNSYDIVVNSEVMEHIKEYENMEYKAIEELKRITASNGLIIVATPNTEMFPDHGFSYEEINKLFSTNFKEYCIFENALFPLSGNEGELWKQRLANGKTGVIISEAINFDETDKLSGSVSDVKVGIPAGTYSFANFMVNTTLLHNTHSWVVLAINNK
jgi:2-polyprenyl-3-methyl-5-hydroxy-6-metoxy-1,4-benzoquinol methylase